jgi:non-ribosomal peptide synthase protein (TIGR01720 family)
LLITIHHLVIDGVSWRVLLEDLQTLYTQFNMSETGALPAKTSSYKKWAETLRDFAQTATLKAEVPYWLGMKNEARLPRDISPTAGDNLEYESRKVSVSLSVEDTRALLTEVPAVYHTQINDVLLTALAQAFAAWTGHNRVLVDLEGQGREDLAEDIDVSRTVGWFTTVFPVLLDLEGREQPGAALQGVKEQLRALPNHGLGYGLLRYLCADETVMAQLAALPKAEIGFNYLGRFDQTQNEMAMFTADEEVDFSHHLHGANGERRHLLSVNGLIVSRQLHFDWTYSERVHRRATVEALAQTFITSLQALIAHCLHSDTASYTSSDFADFDWDQSDLDEITRRIGEISGGS